MSQPAYCTILARNYLPKALALAESLRRHGDGVPLTIVLTDATDEDVLPDVPGVRWMRLAALAEPLDSLLRLAAAYDLVEFATAIKPLVLDRLLEEHEQAAYLDPDTYLTSPLAELSPALESGAGIVLTPHYLEPIPEGQPYSETHMLSVGVYNLGFCAVDRKARPFLAWWWRHLRTECLHDPLSGLFVDQKWMDVGSVLFNATPLRHYGYNVGVANLSERPIAADADGLLIRTTGDRLRLFHFHAFDPDAPGELSVRSGESTAWMRKENPALDALCNEYADLLGRTAPVAAQVGGVKPAYRWDADSTGRPISRRMRHAYRAALLAGSDLPSPFDPAQAAAYTAWRRKAWPLAGRLVASDLAKGARCALPDEYAAIKKKFPGLVRKLRGRYMENNGIWG